MPGPEQFKFIYVIIIIKCNCDRKSMDYDMFNHSISIASQHLEAKEITINHEPNKYGSGLHEICHQYASAKYLAI